MFTSIRHEKTLYLKVRPETHLTVIFPPGCPGLAARRRSESACAPESPAFGKVRRPKTDAALWFSVPNPSGKFMPPENRAFWNSVKEVSCCLSSRLIDKDLLVKFFWTWAHNLSESLGRQDFIHLSLFVNGNSSRTCCVRAERVGETCATKLCNASVRGIGGDSLFTVGTGFGGTFHCLISTSSLTTDKQRLVTKE